LYEVLRLRARERLAHNRLLTVYELFICAHISHRENIRRKTNENNAAMSAARNRMHKDATTRIPTVNMARCALMPGDESMI
jgi:hypothetical protein